jgi:hypothetical protein
MPTQTPALLEEKSSTAQTFQALTLKRAKSEPTPPKSTLITLNSLSPVVATPAKEHAKPTGLQVVDARFPEGDMRRYGFRDIDSPRFDESPRFNKL